MERFTKKELDGLKIKAKELYVQKGMTATGICNTIGVSDKSIGVWVNQYGWKELRKTKEIKRLGGKSNTIFDLNGFAIFLRDKHPLVYSEITPLIEVYKNANQLNHNIKNF